MRKIAGKYIDIKYDILRAILLSMLVTIIWFMVAYYSNTIDVINDKYILFLGGIVALSGLLFRQYMIKEVVDFLSSCNKLIYCIDKITEFSKHNNKINDNLRLEMCKTSENITEYTKYVKDELRIVPIVPLLLILLYGCSMLSCGAFRYATLYIMLLLVSYLSIVSVSSADIATTIVEINKNVEEYESIVKLISDNDN